MKNTGLILIALFLIEGTFAQWSPQNSGTTCGLNSVFFSDSNTGYIVGDSGTILKTTDAGENWVFQNSGTSNELFQVQFPSADTGYIIGYSITPLKTVNGGTDWLPMSSFPVGNSIESLFFTDALTGYITYGSRRVLKTINGGMTWDTIWKFDCSLGSIYFPSDDIGYVVGSGSFTPPDGYVYKTIDGGNNWNLVDSMLICLPTFVYFINPDTGFINTFRLPYASLLFKTTNGGTSWPSSTFYNQYMYEPTVSSIVFLNDVIGYAVGKDILTTYDLGETWIIQDSLLPEYLNSVYFTDSLTGYVVGRNGLILKTTNGGGLPVGLNEYTPEYQFLSVFPNPAKSNATIKSYLIGKKRISIVSLQGQLIKSEWMIGESYLLDCSGLKPGIYLIYLETKKGLFTEKLIIF